MFTFNKRFFSVLTVLFVLFLSQISVNAQQKEEFDWNNLDKMVEEEFGPIVRGTEQAKMVEDAGKKIAAWVHEANLKLSFKLIQNDEPNAFAFGNGNVYVLTGLFKTLKTADELAFVMAHEISHVLLQHSAKAEEFANKNSVKSNDDLMMKAFTREQEYEADKYGTLLTIRAGFSPLGSVNWFNNMTNMGFEYPPRYVENSDHPNFTQRVVQSFINIGTYYEYAKNFDYGVLYLSTGDYADAAESFKKFLEKYPNYKEAYNNIGVALLASKVAEKEVNLDLWINAAISRVQFFKGNFDEPVRGKFNLAVSDFVEAREYLTKALQYDKKYSDAYANLALIDVFLGDYSKAKRNVDDALKYDKNSFRAYIILGFLHSQQNNFKEAAAAFKKAGELEKNNPQALFNLAYCYQWNNQKELASTTWKSFLEVMPQGYFANIAYDNLAELSGTKTDVTINTKENSSNTVLPSIAGVTINDTKEKVTKVLKAPGNKTTMNGQEVWEYLTPNITIGFASDGTVEWVNVLDNVKSGLEYVNNVTVNDFWETVVKKLGYPESTWDENGYTVYNYPSKGIAIYLIGGYVKGIGIYEIN